MTIREKDIRHNDESGIWHSVKWRFEKKTFGKMTIRKNDFQLNDVSQNCRSAKYRFEKMIFYIISFR